MVVQDPSGAQIELILASNDAAQIRQLRQDVETSKFSYSFVHLSDRASLVANATRHIALNGGKIPIVMVINYKFAGADCDFILRAAKAASAISAIESVVTDPPRNNALRQRLIHLGARLFNSDSADIRHQLTLH